MTTTDPRPVYDMDAHICEPPVVWEEYCDPAYRDLILRAGPGPTSTDAMWVNGECRDTRLAQACIPGAYGDNTKTWDDITPGSYDPAERLKVMDEEGLDLALIFPSLELIAGDIERADVAAANARAYNRWITDFVAHDQDRFMAMGVCPLQSVDAAVAEVGFIAEQGLTGITFRPERYNGLELFSPEMGRVWSAAEDAGLIVGIHGSFGSRMPSFASSRYENQFYTHMVCHPFEAMACVMEIVASGVLDDHPNLRVSFVESGIGWLPYWLGRLDEHKEHLGQLVPRLKRKPSEIWAEQCFITMEGDEIDAYTQLVDIGVGHTVIWGSDYPHYDCTFPGALAKLDHSFASVGHADRRDEVTYTNARHYLGL
ncbi:MAG: amidohydrolase family protein [Actinomycetia bacterium]|nr:amidohydrolase family protein [Actinomycetes bacterium]